jgi:midasin
LARCLQSEEPALLIGETGLGKTSVCQILAKIRGQKLRIINCNHHTESSDFLGGYRPNRSRREAYDEFKRNMKLFIQFSAKHGLEAFEGGSVTDMQTLQVIVAEALRIAEGAPEKIKMEAKKIAATMSKCLAKYCALFEWVDGPLTLAMKEGDIILIDELNLAEDAVLERLNRRVVSYEPIEFWLREIHLS